MHIAALLSCVVGIVGLSFGKRLLIESDEYEIEQWLDIDDESTDIYDFDMVWLNNQNWNLIENIYTNYDENYLQKCNKYYCLCKNQDTMGDDHQLYYCSMESNHNAAHGVDSNYIIWDESEIEPDTFFRAEGPGNEKLATVDHKFKMDGHEMNYIGVNEKQRAKDFCIQAVLRDHPGNFIKLWKVNEAVFIKMKTDAVSQEEYKGATGDYPVPDHAKYGAKKPQIADPSMGENQYGVTPEFFNKFIFPNTVPHSIRWYYFMISPEMLANWKKAHKSALAKAVTKYMKSKGMDKSNQKLRPKAEAGLQAYVDAHNKIVGDLIHHVTLIRMRESDKHTI